MAKKKGTGSSKRIGRWAPIGMKAVTAEWKALNPADENLIFLLDSTSGEITVCGDTSGVRAALGASAVVTPAAPPPGKPPRKPR